MPVFRLEEQIQFTRAAHLSQKAPSSQRGGEDEPRCQCGAVQAACLESGMDCPGWGGTNNADYSPGLQPANRWSLPSPEPLQRDTDCTDSPVHLLDSSFSSSSSSALSFGILVSISPLLLVRKIWPTSAICKKILKKEFHLLAGKGELIPWGWDNLQLSSNRDLRGFA